MYVNPCKKIYIYKLKKKSLI
jgi:hypothetical protein